MKRFFILALIALTLFVSCKNGDLIEYIEKGFAKPSVQDIYFKKFSLGDENKIYVPSKEEIEVELTIKNKYETEITGSLEIDEVKKALFNTCPYIKSLTPTKMVVVFNFKETEEPSEANNFLGASVPINLKLYDKKNSRFLSSQTIYANCNSAPIPIPEEKLIYSEAGDEYVVTLPKNDEGKHKDLQRVEFFLSDKHGHKSVRPKIFSIVEQDEQNVIHHLKIKGDEDWQLRDAYGDRTIKAIVYDKAGLKSREGEKVSNRTFTTITLDSEYVDVDLSSVENGIKVPKIKELVEYFQTKEAWKKAGYHVLFESDTFEYDCEKDKLVKKNNITLEAKSYNVVVKLTGGHTTLTETYEINIVPDDSAGINTSSFLVTDITNENNYSPLTLPHVTFEDDGVNEKKLVWKCNTLARKRSLK